MNPCRCFFECCSPRYSTFPQLNWYWDSVSLSYLRLISERLFVRPVPAVYLNSITQYHCSYSRLVFPPIRYRTFSYSELGQKEIPSQAFKLMRGKLLSGADYRGLLIACSHEAVSFRIAGREDARAFRNCAVISWSVILGEVSFSIGVIWFEFLLTGESIGRGKVVKFFLKIIPLFCPRGFP